ncbi:MAG: GspH/FimT family pseudopilin, partial [Ectothiorhodospiraceae bacterium]
MRNERGFTLIELMITIAIAAILITVAVPGFQNLLQSNRVTSSTNELITAIATARSHAIRRGNDVRVDPDGDWTDGFVIEELDDSGAATGPPVRQFDGLDNTLAIDDDDGGGAPGTLTFDGRGTLASEVTFGIQPSDGCDG